MGDVIITKSGIEVMDGTFKIVDKNGIEVVAINKEER